ncbi:MAG: pyruvate kinase [Burkholderiales bacterium]
MARFCHAKIVATLGPASSSLNVIRALFSAGADVFRLNFSHGTHEEHAQRLALIRQIEKEVGRPIGVLIDLQGPKLRVGRFQGAPVTLVPGAVFRLDLDDEQGDAGRVGVPHKEIFVALRPGMDVLLDDGRIRLRVEECSDSFANTRVLIGGELSERKGVNVPDVVLPVAALTEKDRHDLEFGLELGVEWLALSFVQRPEDLDEARELTKGRAWIVAKLEKPCAVDRLEEIAAKADAIMVARGDLGVELPSERVPPIQKRAIRVCRKLGKPVIVATQMLDSMVTAPAPTRAETSDVATAIYDGADAVMLSAESAIGKYAVETVKMMDNVIAQVESDPHYRILIEASYTPAESNYSDAICAALRRVTGILNVAATVTYTSSGFTSLRAARERAAPPIISMTPNLATARRLALVWGVHSVQTRDITRVRDMVDDACETALRDGFAKPGDTIVITAGMPFGTPGATNLLRIAKVPPPNFNVPGGE